MVDWIIYTVQYQDMWYTRFGQSSNYSDVTSFKLLDLHTKSWIEKDLEQAYITESKG